MTDEMLNAGETTTGARRPRLSRAHDPIIGATGPDKEYAARPTPAERRS